MKYTYWHVLQADYGDGWEDIEFYRALTSTGKIDALTLMVYKIDVKEYQALALGAGYSMTDFRLIFRRIPKKGVK